ncbi:MAG TPA: CHAT domain-containing protein [Thermoanaerobaculia bacterium]|nr:CHAT domain-containing protein [Thermoanaerobaculia bacterium]
MRSTRPLTDRPGVHAAMRSIQRAAAARLSPTVAADLAVVELIGGRPGAAMAELEKAAGESGDARLLSDLAALCLASFARTGNTLDLLKALDAALRATQSDAVLPAAKFNEAMVLERLSLVDSATRAWRAYLQLDAASPWAREAAARLHGLDRLSRAEAWHEERGGLEEAAARDDWRAVASMVARFRQAARLYGEEEVLPAWGAARAAGEEQRAGRLLTIARAVGTSLARLTGDAMLRDSVAAIDESFRHADRDRLAALARGHGLYGQGLDLARRGVDSAALEQFAQARDALAWGRTPFAGWALLKLAEVEIRFGRFKDVIEELAPLREPATSVPYLSLRARAYYLSGLASIKIAKLADSLELYRNALALYTRVGEEEYVAGTHFNISESLRFQGERELAWRHRCAALDLTANAGPSVYRYNTLFDAAEAALKDGMARVALVFQDEMVRIAVAIKDALRLSQSLVRRSRTRNVAGNAAGARHDLLAAERYLQLLPPGQTRNQLEADVAVSRAGLSARETPRDAIRALDEAIGFYQRNQESARLPALYYQRALASFAAGDAAEGNSDLAAGIGECERERHLVRGQELKISYFDQAEPIYDEMIRAEAIRDGDRNRAFDYSERFRARHLLELLGAAGPWAAESAGSKSSDRVISAAAARRALPQGTALVEYAVLPERLLVWTLTRENLDFETIPVEKPVLESLVLNLHARLAAGRPDAVSLASELYGVLVRPLQPHLGGVTALVVVPDKILHFVPFAALRDSAAQKFVVEEYAVSIAPSATLYVKAMQRAEQMHSWAGAKLLAVANPAFSRAAYPALPNLPDAEVEARQLASLYPDAVILGGAQATKTAFLTSAPAAAVIHLAVHAVSNDQYPLLSALVLAPETAAGKRDSGSLYAHELYRADFARTRLAVLAACDTAVGRFSSSEGVESLARPFLARGVPAVVATLWRLDDFLARQFFAAFYRRLRSGMDPLTSLRETQLQMLRSPDRALRDPATWGTFDLIGATSRAMP